MEDVLPTDADKVPPITPGNLPPGVQLTEKQLKAELREFNFRRRLEDRRRFHRSQRAKFRALGGHKAAAEAQGRSKKGKFAGRYAHKKAWLYRKARLDPVALQRRLDSDGELKRLYARMKIPHHVVKKQIGAALLAVEKPKLLAKMKAIQAEIEPLVEKLMRLDERMRRYIGEMEYLEWRARNVVPPNKAAMQARIRQRIKRISVAMARQQVARDRLAIKTAHGFWNYLDKRYGSKPMGKEGEVK